MDTPAFGGLQPGDSFGRYRIERLLGVGGMGAVLLATDTVLGRQVALKMIAPQLAADPEFVRRFEAEAHALGRLNSPHVIGIHDHGTIEGRAYMATQFVSGGELGALLGQRGPLPVPMAAALCAQIAEALADAHAAGVVHRDVKPGNVLVRDPDSPVPHGYLCDFGIAQTESDSTTTAGITGSWGYLAPERLHGERATPATDIYSLGCLFFAALTGQPPYVGDEGATAMGHLKEPVPRFAGSSATVRMINAILAASMAKDPADRFPGAAEMARDLHRLAELGQGQGPLQARRASARTASGGRRLVAAGVATVLVLALGGGAYAAWQLGSGDGSSDSPAAGSGGAPDGPVDTDLGGSPYGDVALVTSTTDTDKTPPGMLLESTGTGLAEPEKILPTGLRQYESSRSMLRADLDGKPGEELYTLAKEFRETDEAARLVPQDGGDPIEIGTFPRGWFNGATTGDFTGDGVDDLALMVMEDYRKKGDKDPMKMVVAPSQGPGELGPFESWGSVGKVPYARLRSGDVDGDGTDDLITLDPGDGTSLSENDSSAQLYLSDGRKFTAEGEATRLIGTNEGKSGKIRVTAADIDGDEKTELVLTPYEYGYSGKPTRIQVVNFDGGWQRPQNWATLTITDERTGYQQIRDVVVSDLDANGAEDLLVRIETDAPSLKGETAYRAFLSDGATLTDKPWGTLPSTEFDPLFVQRWDS